MPPPPLPPLWPFPRLPPALQAASNLEDMKREIAIMKKLKHPHVLRLYEVMDDPKVNKLYLVLEYMKVQHSTPRHHFLLVQPLFVFSHYISTLSSP